MVDDTLVDEQPSSSTLLPIADPEDEVALLPQDNEKGKDIVKWIEVGLGAETKKVPFVYNTITRKVYCGATTMKLKRGQNGQVYVNCLSGCLSLLTDSVKTPVHVSAMRCLDGTGLIPECKAHCEKTLAELSCCKFIY